MHPLTAYAVPSPYEQGESAIRGEASVIILFPLRISGKPTLAHALLLLKEFLDTPQRGESEYAYEAAHQYVFYKQGTYGATDADEEENPPRAGAEIVFRFDDNGVKQADAEEGGNANKESFVIHESWF